MPPKKRKAVAPAPASPSRPKHTSKKAKPSKKAKQSPIPTPILRRQVRINLTIGKNTPDLPPIRPPSRPSLELIPLSPIQISSIRRTSESPSPTSRLVSKDIDSPIKPDIDPPAPVPKRKHIDSDNKLISTTKSHELAIQRLEAFSAEFAVVQSTYFESKELYTETDSWTRNTAEESRKKLFKTTLNRTSAYILL